MVPEAISIHAMALAVVEMMVRMATKIYVCTEAMSTTAALGAEPGRAFAEVARSIYKL
jgi:hypothetical protein